MKKEYSYKRFTIIFITFFVVSIVAAAGFVWIIDPFFHYHFPSVIQNYELRTDEKRYINSGLARNFEYDAIITGSSMIWNFKTTEMDKLFDVNSIKLPFPSGILCEVGDNLKIALESHNVCMVVQSIDPARLLYMRQDFIDGDGKPQTYPYYIQDDRLINDYNYVLNKAVLIRSLEALRYNASYDYSTSFDEYSLFGEGLQSGINEVYDSIDNHSDYIPILDEAFHLSETQTDMLKENLLANVIELVRQHPETEFYLFIPPYSISWWESYLYRGNLMEYYFEMFDETAEILLQEENIHLYCFYDDYDLICNFDNYLNYSHYTSDVNSYILQCMKNGKHELTKENYKDYFSDCYEFYRKYDYEHLYDDLN